MPKRKPTPRRLTPVPKEDRNTPRAAPQAQVPEPSAPSAGTELLAADSSPPPAPVTDPASSPDSSASANQPAIPPTEAGTVSGPATQLPAAAAANDSSPPRRRVHIAVIGDVTVDWAFISREPSRPRFPVFKPWTRDPAAHMFALPGGAWLSGHMLQGALVDPVFARTYEVRTGASKGNLSTHIALDASLSIPKEPPDAVTLMIELPPPDQRGGIDIIVNDEIELDVSSFVGFEVKLKSGRHTPDLQFAAGLTDATLEVNDEYDPSPGFFGVDQVARRFEAEHVTVPGKVKLACTFLSVSNADLTFDPLTFEPEPPPGKVRTRPEGLPDQVTSLKIVPKRLRRGEVSSGPRIVLEVDPSAGLRLKRATIDVTFGKLSSWIRLNDRGKLNPPKTDVPAQDAVTVAPDAADGKLISPAADAGRGSLLGVTLQPTVPGPKSGIDWQLWSYANPGDTISMQHPGHIVHTLSELSLFDRHDDKPTLPKVYRRCESHGVDGPEHGYPTILGEYDHGQPWVKSQGVGPSDPTPASPQRDWGRGTGDGWRLVCIDDEGLGFSRRCDNWHPFLWPSEYVGEVFGGIVPTTYNDFKARLGAKKWEDVKTHVGRTWFLIKASHWLDSNRSDLLRFLRDTGACDRTILVVSGESLRKGLTDSPEKPGIKLSKKLSWERTAEEFVASLVSGTLGKLADNMHIVVRFGLEGSLHYHRGQLPGKDRRVWLSFDPKRIEGEYAEPGRLGIFPGLTTVFTSVLARHLSEELASAEFNDDKPSNIPVNQRNRVAKAINRAIPDGLMATRRFYDLGYGPTAETVRKFSRLQLPLSQTFSRGRIDGLRDYGKHKFVECPIPWAREDRAPPSWSILSQCLKGSPPPARTGSEADPGQSRDAAQPDPDAAQPEPDAGDPARVGAPDDYNVRYDESFLKAAHQHLRIRDHEDVLVRAIHAVTLGRDIVLHGFPRAIDRLSVRFPFATFGDLLAVDRREIEGLRSIHNLFSEYIRHSERKVPISVAVFGPPGSGKSFGVKQIAQQVTKGRIREFVFNLAQFTSFQDVTRLLLQVRDAALDGQVPLVFFDEFDCTLGDAPLGWLKFFLSPMNDGKFQHENSMLNIGKAIFVFAGGIATKHDEFRDENYWKDRGGARPGESNVFTAAKGPDFHSRLRGFLDIVGPNPNLLPAAGTPDYYDPFAGDDFTFVIRRAILIRQIIEQLHNDSLPRGFLDSEDHAEVDNDVLDALLLTNGYLHGVRSLRAIFEMSAVHGERALSKTAIPSREQLQMHTDPSFYSILSRDYDSLKSAIIRGLFQYFTFLSSRDRQARRESNDDAAKRPAAPAWRGGGN